MGFDVEHEWALDRKLVDKTYYVEINQNNIRLFGIIKENFDSLKQVYPLVEFIIDRFETITYLIQDDRVWDAEITYRSALEAFFKLLYITSSPKDKQDGLLDEFWNQLSEINALKVSERAKENLKVTNKDLYRIAYAPLVLPEHLELELREKWPNKTRKKLEQKWSFTEIINSITNNYKGTRVEEFGLALHSYRMSSHVTHGDENGINIIRERRSRPANEALIAHICHYLRLINDVYIFCFWLGKCVEDYLEINPSSFSKLSESIIKLGPISRKYENELYSDPSYDKYRSM